VNPFNTPARVAYLERIKLDNPLLAETELYGLPGTTMGAVLAGYMDKIQTNFVTKPWNKFAGGGGCRACFECYRCCFLSS